MGTGKTQKYSEERKRKRMVVVGLGPLVGDYLLSCSGSTNKSVCTFCKTGSLPDPFEANDLFVISCEILRSALHL